MARNRYYIFNIFRKLKSMEGVGSSKVFWYQKVSKRIFFFDSETQCHRPEYFSTECFCDRMTRVMHGQYSRS